MVSVVGVVSHVVLFTPRPDLSRDGRRALVDAFERAVRDIPTVRAVRVGRRVVHGAGYESGAAPAEYLVAIDFDDLEGLRTYLQHPAHQELGARFGQSLDSGFVYDFEEIPIERIGKLR